MAIFIASLVLIVAATIGLGYSITTLQLGRPAVASAATDAVLKVSYSIVAESLFLFITVPRPGGTYLHHDAPHTAWVLVGAAVAIGCYLPARGAHLLTDCLADLRLENTAGQSPPTAPTFR